VHAFRDNRILERITAYHAFEGQLFLVRTDNVLAHVFLLQNTAAFTRHFCGELRASTGTYVVSGFRDPPQGAIEEYGFPRVADRTAVSANSHHHQVLV